MNMFERFGSPPTAMLITPPNREASTASMARTTRMGSTYSMSANIYRAALEGTVLAAGKAPLRFDPGRGAADNAKKDRETATRPPGAGARERGETHHGRRADRRCRAHHRRPQDGRVHVVPAGLVVPDHHLRRLRHIGDRLRRPAG